MREYNQSSLYECSTLRIFALTNFYNEARAVCLALQPKCFEQNHTRAEEKANKGRDEAQAVK